MSQDENLPDQDVGDEIEERVYQAEEQRNRSFLNWFRSALGKERWKGRTEGYREGVKDGGDEIQIHNHEEDRRGFLWLLAGAGLVSVGAIGNKLLEDDVPGDGGQGGIPDGPEEYIGGENQQFYDSYLEEDVEGFASDLHGSKGDFPDRVSEIGSKLDSEVSENSEVGVGFSDNFLEDPDLNSGGYNPENWGLMQVYDTRTLSLEDPGEFVLARESYNVLKDWAGNYGGE